MKDAEKLRLIMLTTSLIFVLSGMALPVCELYEVMGLAKLFGMVNLGIVLIIIGGIISFSVPKPHASATARGKINSEAAVCLLSMSLCTIINPHRRESMSDLISAEVRQLCGVLAR